MRKLNKFKALKEEIKMKAQTSKTKESQQLTNAIFVVHLILVIVIMAFISNYAKPELGHNSLKYESRSSISPNNITPPNKMYVVPASSAKDKDDTENFKMSLMAPINEFQFRTEEIQDLESDKLFQKNKERDLIYAAYKFENSSDSKTDFEAPFANLSLTELNEVLIPADEPELEIAKFINVNKPENTIQYSQNEYLENLRKSRLDELDQFYAHQQILKEFSGKEASFAELNEYLTPEEEPELEVKVAFVDMPEPVVKYSKNEYLENLRKSKLEELDEYYAYQQIVKEYLAVEKEAPLEVEEWMVSERCWCLDRNVALAAKVNTTNK